MQLSNSKMCVCAISVLIMTCITVLFAPLLPVTDAGKKNLSKQKAKGIISSLHALNLDDIPAVIDTLGDGKDGWGNLFRFEIDEKRYEDERILDIRISSAGVDQKINTNDDIILKTSIGPDIEQELETVNIFKKNQDVIKKLKHILELKNLRIQHRKSR